MTPSELAAIRERSARLHSYIDALLAEVERLNGTLTGTCVDCHLRYEADGWPVDLILPLQQWNMIAPQNGSGILCANCMLVRLSKIPDTVCVFARAAFRDDHIQVERLINAESPASPIPSV